MVFKWKNACLLSEITSSMWKTPTTCRRRLLKVREGAGRPGVVLQQLHEPSRHEPARAAR